MRLYIYIAAIFFIIISVVGYTAYHRRDAASAERGKAAIETTDTIDKNERLKDEIRNRPMSDSYTADRLLAGTW